MTPAILTIIIGLHFPYAVTIQFEDIFECHQAMDNYNISFYRKVDQKLKLPKDKATCKEIK